jgi:hypothetical protein
MDPKIKRVPQTKPLEGVSPVELGYVFNNSFDGRDLVRMIIYFAIKGYLKISEYEPKRYRLIRKKDPDGEEKLLRNAYAILFEDVYKNRALDMDDLPVVRNPAALAGRHTHQRSRLDGMQVPAVLDGIRTFFHQEEGVNAVVAKAVAALLQFIVMHHADERVKDRRPHIAGIIVDTLDLKHFLHDSEDTKNTVQSVKRVDISVNRVSGFWKKRTKFALKQPHTYERNQHRTWNLGLGRRNVRRRQRLRQQYG